MSITAEHALIDLIIAEGSKARQCIVKPHLEGWFTGRIMLALDGKAILDDVSALVARFFAAIRAASVSPSA